MVRVWVVRFSVQVMPSPHWPDTISSPAGMAFSVGARVGQKEVGSGSGPGAGCAFPAISAAALPMAATMAFCGIGSLLVHRAVVLRPLPALP